MEVLPIAVGEFNGAASFLEDVQRPGYSRIVNDSTVSLAIQSVETRRLDDLLLRRPRVDLIKLDVEGHELAALRGAEEVLSKWKPTIIFEFGPEQQANEMGLDRRALFRLLRDSGYSIATLVDFVFDKGGMDFEEFRRCGIYPFRAFNFIAYS